MLKIFVFLMHLLKQVNMPHIRVKLSYGSKNIHEKNAHTCVYSHLIHHAAAAL